MGLDMYLEKLPKVGNYKFEEVNELIEVINNADVYTSANQAIAEMEAGTDARMTASKYGLAYFANDTPEKFIERLNIYLSDSRTVSMYGQYLLLSKDTIEAFESKLNGGSDEIAYWRKANHIHNWFVKHVQGGIDECQSSEVTKEQLEQLLADCQTVLENTDSASMILPTASGFFFGGTEYDAYYYADVTQTIGVIKRILEKVDFDEYYVFYQASW